MKHPLLFGFAMGMSVLSGLFFVAGSPRFEWLARDTANFAGMGAGMVCGLLWILWARGQKTAK